MISTKQEIKEGDYVTSKSDCSGITTGKIYKVFKKNNELWIGEEESRHCNCVNKWILVEGKEQTTLLKKEKISIELFREKGKTWLKFEIPEIIENIFKEKSEEIKESNNWKGLKFYYCPQLTTNEIYKTKLRNFGLFDDFGSNLLENQSLNIAFTRTVGGKGQVAINEELPFSVITVKIKNLVAFLKDFYEEYFSDFSAKGSITIEL